MEKDKAGEKKGCEAELACLKDELRRAEEQEAFYKDARRAMLYMLEDLNRTTAAVALAKKEWEETFNAITDPIFIHDSEFRIVLANNAYAQYAGGGEYIGRLYYEVFPRMEGASDICLKAKAGEQAVSEEEEEVEVPQFNKIFRIKHYPIKDTKSGQLYFCHILHDVTKLKKAEQQLIMEVSITTSLLNLSEATAHTKDLDSLMARVAEASARILQADACMLYLYDGDLKVFAPQQSFGLAVAELPLFRSNMLDRKAGFVRSALEAGSALVMHAPFTGAQAAGEGAAHIFLLIQRAVTAVVIPFSKKGGASGLLIGLFEKKTELQDKDKRLVNGIIHQVSSAIEEARLYRDSVEKAIDLSRRIETIKVMREIDRSILSTLEACEILETVTMLLARLVKCERVTVSMADRARGGFIFQAGFGIDLPKGHLVPFSETSATEVLESEQVQYVANAMEEKVVLPLEKFLADSGFMSHLRLPIMVKGSAVAVLSVGSKRPAAFTNEDISTLESLVSQIGVALENARLVADLQELFLATVKTLSKAIDAKSPWTMGHSERVTAIALTVAQKLGLDKGQLKSLELAGLLHDIGKLGTYETILNKPGKLTEDEMNMMKQHPAKGAEILQPIRQLRDIVPGIKHHHEYYDGTGYPDGLKGGAIPFMARILTLADTIDAMGADRPYRKGKPKDVIIAELKRCSGTQFDPQIVEAFLTTL